MDAAEFVEARLAEDEKIAATAASEHSANWAFDGWNVTTASEDDVIVHDEGSLCEGEGRHIVCHDPVRVLCRIAAKRAILARIQQRQHYYNDEDTYYSCAQAVVPEWLRTGREDGVPGAGCGSELAGGPCDCGRDQEVETVARLLASEWSDHPDYDPEWAL